MILLIKNNNKMDEEQILNSEESSSNKDKNTSDDISSGTNESFFLDEDKNLLDKKDGDNKKLIISKAISYTNKFEFFKNNNIIYCFYLDNINYILLFNIFSIFIFLIALITFIIKTFFQIFLFGVILSNLYIILISVMFIPFLICTLSKMIIIYYNEDFKDNENENRDLIRLIMQKWNIYYSISLLLMTSNFVIKIIFIDILNYHYKILFFIDILIIIFALIIFGIIYYLTNSSNDILISNIIDYISFHFSASYLFSYMIIIFIEQLKTLIYNSILYGFLLTCLSLILMVYYNDILGAFLIFIYQLGGIKNISFYNMNFHTFCTLINFGFIIFMTFKSIRKHFFSNNDDNVYCLIKEETSEIDAK